jgi:outer membrane protein assembly factor BamB
MVALPMFVKDPAVGVDGTLYVPVGGELYAISGSGEIRWILKQPDFPTWVDQARFLSPVVDGAGIVYASVGSVNGDKLSGTVYAIAPDGALKWARNIGYAPDHSTFTGPILGSNGVLYVGSEDRLFAVRPNR